jgi:dihydroflavonol-4-reductase
MRELATMVIEITWTRAPQIVLPIWMARLGVPFCVYFSELGGDHPLYTAASLQAWRGNRMISRERAARDLGYHPRPLRETLVDTFRWFAEMGHLRRPHTPRLPPTY